MTETTMTCPLCGGDFELTEALKNKLEHSIRTEVETDLRSRESALHEREHHLTESQKDYERQKGEYEARIAEIVKEKEAAALTHARGEVQLELEDRDNQITELKQQKKDAQEKELALRHREREIAEKEENTELEVLRQVSAQTKALEESIAKATEEKHQQELAERDEQLRSVREKLAEAERKATQGSQQLQGEVLELKIEEMLKQSFHDDEIEPVAKGTLGADVIHAVFDRSGVCCGRMLWEMKRQKNWSEGWIEKLRQDLNDAGADVGIIVSSIRPKGTSSVCLHKGIWIAEPRLADSLAVALRQGLIEVARAKTSVIAKNEKAEALHSYLTSPAFGRRVVTIVETFLSLKNELEKEKNAMQRIWASRNKLIERAMTSTAQMYGELQVVIGSGLVTIPQLELASVEPENMIAQSDSENSENDDGDLPF